MKFRWNDWNREHATKHGCRVQEIESVVESAEPPYPQRREDDRWLVMGRGAGGRFIQVIYVYSPPKVVYVIHARPLTETEKRRYRRRRK